MLGMLIFGTVIVIHRSNYLSESEIDQSYWSQYSLYNVDTMTHIIRGKTVHGVPFCPSVGAKRSNSIYFNFPYHRNGNVFILMKLSSLAALEVVKVTTSSAASDENFVKMTTFLFQCISRI